MVARTLLTKLGRICEISFKNCHLPWWLDDIVNALGMQSMKSAAALREAQKWEMGQEGSWCPQHL